MPTWRNIPGSPHFSVLQATKSWAGPGNEATTDPIDSLVYASLLCMFHPAVPFAVKSGRRAISPSVDTVFGMLPGEKGGSDSESQHLGCGRSAWYCYNLGAG